MKRLVFLVLSALLTLLFLIAVGLDQHREWNRYQRTFFKSLEQHERRGMTGGIKQVIVSNLGRVDRCTTCHLAIDKPQLELGQEPFRSHPGDYLKWHPVEQFGCTVCHGGQGLATEVKAAHGDVPHWEEPLLRGRLVQASCAQCHHNVQEITPQAPLLAKGRALFKAKGCYGCHAIKDFGQSVSVDLAEVGSKSYLLMEADFEMMDPPHDRIRWLMTKLRNPRRLNPGVTPEHLPPGEEEVFPSAMPHFGLSEPEVEALTIYLLGLTASDPPASYVTPAKPEPTLGFNEVVTHGKAVFEKYGCAACHGIGGVGGRKNWNGGLGEEVPSLLYVKAYYGNDVESLKNLIRNGRQPVPRADPHRPQPGLYMPAWKDRISEEDLDALVAYLLSLADRLPAPAPAPGEPPPAEPTARLRRNRSASAAPPRAIN
ncbi:MAG: c-type cytochrome [Candidatus Omnitrophica bacterium]|nr:c-type cytochrome [Candidatus Omnitrophota bacterium]